MNVTPKLGPIDTKPRHDPYVGLGHASRTFLKLDLRDGRVWVEQEYKDNCTRISEWRGLVVTWSVPGHPHEDDVSNSPINLGSFSPNCIGRAVQLARWLTNLSPHHMPHKHVWR